MEFDALGATDGTFPPEKRHLRPDGRIRYDRRSCPLLLDPGEFQRQLFAFGPGRVAILLLHSGIIYDAAGEVAIHSRRHIFDLFETSQQ